MCKVCWCVRCCVSLASKQGMDIRQSLRIIIPGQKILFLFFPFVCLAPHSDLPESISRVYYVSNILRGVSIFCFLPVVHVSIYCCCCCCGERAIGSTNGKEKKSMIHEWRERWNRESTLL